VAGVDRGNRRRYDRKGAGTPGQKTPAAYSSILTPLKPLRSVRRSKVAGPGRPRLAAVQHKGPAFGGDGFEKQVAQLQISLPVQHAASIFSRISPFMIPASCQ